jgi:hypothetical protein
VRSAATPAGSPASVDTIDAADYSGAEFAAHFSNHYRSRNHPVLVRNAARDWPAIQRWTPAYLADKCKGAPTAAMFFGGGLPRGLYLPAEQVLARIQDGEKIYISQASIVEEPHATRPGSTADLPMLAQDCREPAFLAGKQGKSLQAFIGVNTFASMHFHPGRPSLGDCQESVKIQLVGTKRALLFSPRASLKPALISAFNFSKISFDNWLSDRESVLAQFAPLRTLPAYEYTLEPGDMLYIPAYWWHSFYGQGLSMSATYFWYDREPQASATLHTSANYRMTRAVSRILPAMRWMQRTRYRLRRRLEALRAKGRS